MWNAGTNLDIPNLENHLDEIVRAKERLSAINEEIKGLLQQKDQLAQGNHIALQEKSEILDKKRDEIELILSSARELQVKNYEISKDLDKKRAELDAAQIKFNEDSAVNAQFLENGFKDLDLKQKEHEANQEALNVSSRQIDEKHKNANKIYMDAQQLNKETMAALTNSDVKVDQAAALLAEADAKISAMARIKEAAENLNLEAQEKFTQAQKNIEDARILSVNANRQAQENENQKSALVDIIIESKKTASESLNASVEAKRQIAEANQKIAELNTLKASLAK